MINADRRILVCRAARAIKNDTLLVANLAHWLRTLAGR